MTSSNRSTPIPISFDRFRVKSVQFLSPFRNPQCTKRIKRSPERTWTRKTQVHPDSTDASKSQSIEHTPTYLFDASAHTTKHIQNKKCASQKSTSNVNEAFDTRTLSVTNSTRSDAVRHMCPPTPCMIDYRHTSLPNLIPKRLMKRPNSFDQLLQPTDLDQFNT